MHETEVNDMLDLNAEVASRKRGRELALAEQELNDEQDLGEKVAEFHVEITCFLLVSRLTIHSLC